jgi:hypothetical protein
MGPAGARRADDGGRSLDGLRCEAAPYGLSPRMRVTSSNKSNAEPITHGSFLRAVGEVDRGQPRCRRDLATAGRTFEAGRSHPQARGAARPSHRGKGVTARRGRSARSAPNVVGRPPAGGAFRGDLVTRRGARLRLVGRQAVVAAAPQPKADVGDADGQRSAGEPK